MRTSFTVVGTRHFGYDYEATFIYYFDASNALEAADLTYAQQAECDLRAYFENGFGVDGDAEPLSYSEALETARYETTIVAVFAGHHVDCSKTTEIAEVQKRLSRI